ncbi:MAG: PhnD/SsuA/transferrin family substrate-binding protein [Nitriliruptorales bacterium]|nr:PhnD/SsuA/transferrin family substrate-binding protein [Nitriliruptorales bacterium]
MVVVLTVLALIAVGCGGQDDGGGEGGDGGATATEEPAGDGEEAATTGETESITVLLPNPSAVNVFNLCAAMGEGYLAEEGIEVTVEAVDGSGPVLQAMVAGQAEIGLPGPGPILNARARGEEVRMFYNSFAQSLFGLVAPDDSEIETVDDLEGHTIGVGTAEGAEVSYARGILADAGMEEDTDYEFLPVGDGGQATAAFQRGDIVAYSAAISDMAIIEARGLPLREITPEEFLAFFGNGYAAMADFMEENPDLIEGFAQAMLRGNEWALDNKEGTLEHCAEINPEEGADTELTAVLYDAITARSQPLGEEPVGAFPVEGWEAWEQNLLDSGELDEPVDDLNAAYTNEFVESGS